MRAPSGGGWMGLTAKFAVEMGRLLGPEFPKTLGLAVSGGGDSMAMLHLAGPWARVMGISLRVITVDHGLRADSAGEAEIVSQEAALLGLPHHTARWTGWDRSGNLQNEARSARHALIGVWRGEIEHVLFAHTQDDQAETVLMRLARGSGVEGLSGMAPVQAMPEGWAILRPLLGSTRAELHHFAQVLKIPYVDDPSNDDPRFDRVKARQALDALEPLGLTREGLVRTANAMAGARKALGRRAAQVAGKVSRFEHGHLVFDRDGLASVETDTQRRIMAAALQWTGHDPYRPRFDSLSRMLDEAQAGKSGTLHGCQIVVGKSAIHVVREYEAVRQSVASEGPWDDVWHLKAETPGDYTLRALGPEGLKQIDRPPGVPAAALYSLPAVWNQETVVSVPGLKPGKVRLIRQPEGAEFINSLILR